MRLNERKVEEAGRGGDGGGGGGGIETPRKKLVAWVYRSWNLT